VEIVPAEDCRFFDYQAKYQDERTLEICPARIPEETARTVRKLALMAHKNLYCKGYSRTDMIINEKGIFVLETNTIPGMTPQSLLPKAAKAAGISFSELLDRLIALALEK
jgi:D-alanine-D-alanine ligase